LIYKDLWRWHGGCFIQAVRFPPNLCGQRSPMFAPLAPRTFPRFAALFLWSNLF
jgi:hypothetical protein